MKVEFHRLLPFSTRPHLENSLLIGECKHYKESSQLFCGLYFLVLSASGMRAEIPVRGFRRSMEIEGSRATVQEALKMRAAIVFGLVGTLRILPNHATTLVKDSVDFTSGLSHYGHFGFIRRS
jgi:hypothetical protein